MSTPYVEQADELLGQARQQPAGALQLQLNEQAVRLADQSQHPELAFFARLELINAATNAGHPEKAMVAFAWCLARFKQDLEQYIHFEEYLLWYFKFVIDGAWGFPQISLEKIESMLGEMSEVYGMFGYSQRSVHYMRWQVTTKCKNLAGTQADYDAWQRMDRDEMADCDACERDSQCDRWMLANEHQRAFDTACDILAGTLSCGQIPHRTDASLLRSLALLGHDEQAQRSHQRGYRLIRDNSKFVSQVACHIAWLMHQQNLRRAVTLLERHLPQALASTVPWDQYCFYLVAALLLERLDRRTSKLRLPSEFELHSPDDQYELVPLANWFRRQADDLAAQFDARNGNNYCATRMQDEFVY